MLRIINSLKKAKTAALGVVSSLVIISCGSYQPVSYDNDGIYGSNRQTQQRVATPVNTNTQAPVANSNSYFTQKLNEYENAASGSEVLTDIENYSSQEYYDQPQANNENGYYPGWGQDPQQQTTQVYANVGWGYNNYYPFWNRGFRNGWNNWGGGWNNWVGGWNDPFWNGGFYGGGFYGGGFYGGGVWGNNLWLGNGFYNNRFNNRFYGNRRFVNNRNNVRQTVRRNYTPRYSGNRNSTRSNSRAYTPRQSSSNQSARSSNSSSRTYSPRSSNSSSRSYSPRSSSSSRSSSSARSSRSSSSSRSGGTYRRR